jgi:hypothetical protein
MPPQPPPNVHHEDHLRARMLNDYACKERNKMIEGRDKLLLDHYLRGGEHPDDVNLPIDLWEKIRD